MPPSQHPPRICLPDGTWLIDTEQNRERARALWSQDNKNDSVNEDDSENEDDSVNEGTPMPPSQHLTQIVTLPNGSTTLANEKWDELETRGCDQQNEKRGTSMSATGKRATSTTRDKTQSKRATSNEQINEHINEQMRNEQGNERSSEQSTEQKTNQHNKEHRETNEQSDR